MAGDIMWKTLTTDANLALMTQVLGVKEPTAAVMANRGIRSKNAAIAYLRGGCIHAIDVISMKDAEAAFKRINYAIQQKERIIVYGDYDVDGVMSTVILYKSLKVFANVNFYIPHREEEGYGLNIDAVQEIKKMGCDLIITCDNGISALDEIAEAQSLGIDVIVIDHHEPGFEEDGPLPVDLIPNAVAVIDPKQSACPYPFKEMCAAGLSFKLMEAFYRHTNRDFSPLHDELLALAAIAAVCDIVELMDENRALVKQGLQILNANKNINPGLGQLITLRGYMDKPMDTFTIGFVLGPCINATGRLESAEKSVRLLLSKDESEQRYLANALSDLNDERKSLQRLSVDRILKKAADEVADGGPFSKVLVLVDEDTHESIAGIVAGRIKEELYRPVIVLTRGAGALKGSGRSIEGYNLFEALYANRELFLRFGGHAMAAGMTLEESNVPVLRRRLNENCNLQDSDFQEVIYIDWELPAHEITLKLAEELELLSPFGKGNREPMFVTRGLTVAALRMIDEKNTLIFTFADRIKGIAFGKNEVFYEKLRGCCNDEDYRRILSGQVAGLVMDVVHTVEVNVYNGRKSVQIRIRDFRLAV